MTYDFNKIIKNFKISGKLISCERYGEGHINETYLAEADELATFIYEAREVGRDIICQCDYGQSRSAACAAAILQHFEKRGIIKKLEEIPNTDPRYLDIIKYLVTIWK